MSPPLPRPEEPPRAPLLAGLVLVVAGLVAYGAARYYWRERIPPGWTWTSTFVGIATPAGPDGQFPERDTTAIYERRFEVAEENRRPDRVLVTDSYLNRDPRTGRVIYDYTVRFSVDPRTGRHRPPHANDYLVFPRDTQRRTYSMRTTYLKGIPLTFSGEDEVEGVDVYRFHYAGPMEYTDFYRGTADVPGMAIPPDQEVRCLDDRYELTYWVEPVTGEVVRMAEACHSADVLVDRATRAFRGNVLRWSAESSGNDMVRRVDQVWKQRMLMRASLRYVPLALLLCGTALAALGLRRLRPATGKHRA